MLFRPWQLKHVVAPNRLVRSATYEGLADEDGRLREELGDLYATLAANDVGTIVTGFNYISRQGRAMQPRQCGIDSDDKTAAWAKVIAKVRSVSEPTVMLMQIAHTGLQTLPEITGLPALAPSVWRSPYFRTTPVAMTPRDIRNVIGEFGAAAARAKQARFDGVQLHAAHGYLIHQFLSPHINQRRDEWGSDRFAFLREIIAAVKEACGDEFPVFVKLSVPDGHPGGVTVPLAIEYAHGMKHAGIEAVEISTGTMDVAFDIFRGGAPIDVALRHNPLFSRKPAWLKWLWRRFAFPRMRRTFPPFSEGYNVAAARAVKEAVGIPVIVVGGMRSLDTMEQTLGSCDADAVALCRPLVCEPDLGRKFKLGAATQSACTNCNVCAVMCDSPRSLRCYRQGGVNNVDKGNDARE